MKATIGLTAILLTSGVCLADSAERSSDSTKEQERKMHKTVSADMNLIMQRLESDWDFIGEFLDAPEKAIKDYNLSESEKAALTTRDIGQLMKLGLTEEEVTVAMSGTHRGGKAGIKR